MPRAKFYPHEKLLHDLRLKQEDLPESIQNQIQKWKDSKTKTGYHSEYVGESERISSLIQEWQNMPTLNHEYYSYSQSMKEYYQTNDSEINEENEDLENEISELIEEIENEVSEPEQPESFPNESETIEEQKPNESEIQTGLSVPIPNQPNPFYDSLNKIEKLCYDLLKEVKESQIEQPVFSLEYLQSKGLNTGFWSNFSKLSGYEGKHYNIIRVSSTPTTYYQIKQKS